MVSLSRARACVCVCVCFSPFYPTERQTDRQTGRPPEKILFLWLSRTILFFWGVNVLCTISYLRSRIAGGPHPSLFSRPPLNCKQETAMLTHWYIFVHYVKFESSVQPIKLSPSADKHFLPDGGGMYNMGFLGNFSEIFLEVKLLSGHYKQLCPQYVPQHIYRDFAKYLCPVFSVLHELCRELKTLHRLYRHLKL